MKDRLRANIWKLGNKFNNHYLVDRFNSTYYKYAQKNISCNCPLCKCPSQNGLMYSFDYIHEKSNLMYYDTPKCASTSIRTALFNGDNSFSMTNPEKKLIDYYKFTFVRNPWDRMVSNWKMFTTQPMRIKQLKSMTNQNLANFEDFIHFSKHKKNHHWQPQTLFLPENLDFVGRVENFDNDFEKLLNNIGETPQNPLHKNKTQRKNYREYYTKSTIKLVAELYKEDIKTFGYCFD